MHEKRNARAVVLRERADEGDHRGHRLFQCEVAAYGVAARELVSQ